MMDSTISTNMALQKVIESLNEYWLICLNISKIANSKSSSFACSCNLLMISTSFKQEEEMLSGEFAKVDEGRVAMAGGRPCKGAEIVYTVCWRFF